MDRNRGRGCVRRRDGAPSIRRLLLLSERAALTAFLRGRPCGKRSGHAMAAADYFPSRPRAALYIARQNSRLPPSSAVAPAAVAALGGAGPVRPPPFVAMKAAMSAADPTKEARHDDRAQRHRLRAAARHIPDRSRPHRTPAPRLSPLPGRTRPATAARRPMPSPPPSPTSSTPSSRA